MTNSKRLCSALANLCKIAEMQGKECVEVHESFGAVSLQVPYQGGLCCDGVGELMDEHAEA